MVPKPPAASRPDDERRHEANPVQREFHRIAACLDGSELAERVLPHARAVASALGSRLSLLRVIETGGTGAAPLDPLEWDILRGDAREYLERLVGAREERTEGVEAEVIEGSAAEQICAWTEHHGADLTVVASHGTRGRTDWGIASTARKLLDRLPGSILLVPAAPEPSGPVAHYRCLLAPLDGSARAESVLPLAVQLAKAQGAELLLAHVVPVPELTEIGPLDADDLELRERLVQRN
jgi:nucleotide-binding universal stress UspA family protein